jgi:hypothetical protein
MRIKKKKNSKFETQQALTPPPAPFLNFCDVAMNGRPWSTRGIRQIWVHVEEEDPSFSSLRI